MLPDSVPDESQNYLIPGVQWNNMRSELQRGANISVDYPLTIINVSDGIRITFDHPLFIRITVKITGPVYNEGGETPQKGRFKGNPVNGPVSGDVKGDLKADDFGKADTSRLYEVWNESLTDIPKDTVVSGWMVANRPTDGGENEDGRGIIVVNYGGGGLPTGQYQGMTFQMLTDNDSGFGFPVATAINITP